MAVDGLRKEKLQPGSSLQSSTEFFLSSRKCGNLIGKIRVTCTQTLEGEMLKKNLIIFKKIKTTYE